MNDPRGRPAAVPLSPILAVNFVGSLGFSIVLPFLVYVVTRFGGNAVIYGIIGATYSVFQLIGAPILGRWSDRVGRRRILLLSQAGTLLSWGIFLVALRLPTTPMAEIEAGVLGAFTITVPLVVLFVGRALDGLTGGNVSVANAYVADITPDDDRNANFGKMAASSNLGFVLGPAIAGVLGATAMGETVPVATAFGISVVACLLIWFLLPESHPCVLGADPERAHVGQVLGPDQKECYELKAAPTLPLRDVLRLGGVPLLLALQFLIFLAFNFFYVAFPVHAATRLEWTLTETGVFFSVLSLLLVVVQGPVLKWAAARWDERSLTVAGSLLLAASFVFFLSDSTAVIYAGTALLALGNGVMWPSLQAALSMSAGKDTQGTVQGLASSGSALASIVGLLAGGLLYGVVEAATFGASAAITAGVFGLAFAIPARPASRRGAAGAEREQA